MMKIGTTVTVQGVNGVGTFCGYDLVAGRSVAVVEFPHGVVTAPKAQVKRA